MRGGSDELRAAFYYRNMNEAENHCKVETDKVLEGKSNEKEPDETAVNLVRTDDDRRSAACSGMG